MAIGHERRPDENRVGARVGRGANVIRGAQPALDDDRRSSIAGRADEPHRRIPIHLEGVEIPRVDADEGRIGRQCTLELGRTVGLDQGVQPGLARGGEQEAQPIVGHGADDDEDGRRTERTRLPDLVRVDGEVLAQHRNAGASCRNEVIVAAAEARRLGEHRQRGGPGPRVAGREEASRLGPFGDVREAPGRGRGTLELGDDGELHGVAKRGLEARGVGHRRGAPAQLAQRRHPCVAARADPRGVDERREHGHAAGLASAVTTSAARPESIAAPAGAIPSATLSTAPATNRAAAALRTTTSRAGPGSPPSTDIAIAAFICASPPAIAATGAGSRPRSAASMTSSRVSRPSTRIAWLGPSSDSSSVPSAP